MREDELLDVVDERGRWVRTALRSECNSNPALIHRSVCVLLFDAQGRLFLQRRALAKDLCPGMHDLSATGHPRAGEDIEEAAHRELVEELGVDADLQHVSTLLVRLPHETELTEVYVGEHDGPLRPNPEELEGGGYYSVLAALHVPDLTDYAAQILDALFGPRHGQT